MKTINWYKNKVCLNVLAKDLQNAKDIYESVNGHVLVGILSKNYKTVQDASKEMKIWSEELDNNISIGLGAGDPNQSYMVAELTKLIKPNHANQVFTGVGLSVDNFYKKTTFINCLVSPTGKVGFVKISTGPISSEGVNGIVSIEAAINIIKDMGGDSIKFFNMQGTKYLDEYKKVCEACAKANFGIEPTGGIDLNNFEEILTIPITLGVKKIIPHVYSSIIDSGTGYTKVEDMKELMKIIIKVVK